VNVQSPLQVASSISLPCTTTVKAWPAGTDESLGGVLTTNSVVVAERFSHFKFNDP